MSSETVESSESARLAEADTFGYHGHLLPEPEAACSENFWELVEVLHNYVFVPPPRKQPDFWLHGSVG
jgi:hypothetical protein